MQRSLRTVIVILRELSKGARLIKKKLRGDSIGSSKNSCNSAEVLLFSKILRVAFSHVVNLYFAVCLRFNLKR